MKTVKIIGHNEIDKTRWDRLVEQSPISFPYWKSWYLDIVSPNWKAVIYNNYQFVLPLPKRKKFTFNYIFTPDFTQQLGVFGKEIPSVDVVTQMIEAASKKIRYIELNLNETNTIGFLTAIVRKRRNFELALTDSYSTLFKKFHTNTRRNIKKTQKENLEIEDCQSASQIILAFKENKAKQLGDKLKIDYGLLEQLIEEGLLRKLVEIKNILIDGKFVGGAIFINEQKRKVFLFSALTPEGRNKKASFYLLNRIIEENAESDTILDFEGSDNKNLGTFYHRFGAEEKLYLHLKINRLPLGLKYFKK